MLCLGNRRQDWTPTAIRVNPILTVVAAGLYASLALCRRAETSLASVSPGWSRFVLTEKTLTATPYGCAYVIAEMKLTHAQVR
jgi:hypothetical protein